MLYCLLRHHKTPILNDIMRPDKPDGHSFQLLYNVKNDTTAAANFPSSTMPTGILSVTQFAERYSGTDVHNPLCWFKDILPTPTTGPNGEPVIPPIPRAHYTVELIRNSNVLCYGNSNPLRVTETANSNLALFTMVGAIDLTASNFRPFGSANTKEAVSPRDMVYTKRG